MPCAGPVGEATRRDGHGATARVGERVGARRALDGGPTDDDVPCRVMEDLDGEPIDLHRRSREPDGPARRYFRNPLRPLPCSDSSSLRGSSSARMRRICGDRRACVSARSNWRWYCCCGLSPRT